eukprot:5950692-Pyramimonas_sp.AAC.1
MHSIYCTTSVEPHVLHYTGCPAYIAQCGCGLVLVGWTTYIAIRRLHHAGCTPRMSRNAQSGAHAG